MFVQVQIVELDEVATNSRSGIAFCPVELLGMSAFLFCLLLLLTVSCRCVWPKFAPHAFLRAGNKNKHWHESTRKHSRTF